MLRTELADLVSRGFEVSLYGTCGYWTCTLTSLRDRSKWIGGGSSPEEAVADALEETEYKWDEDLKAHVKP